MAEEESYQVLQGPGELQEVLQDPSESYPLRECRSVHRDAAKVGGVAQQTRGGPSGGLVREVLDG